MRSKDAQYKCEEKPLANRFHKTAEFKDILPRLTLERDVNRWKMGNSHGNSLQYTHTDVKETNPKVKQIVHFQFILLQVKILLILWGTTLTVHVSVEIFILAGHAKCRTCSQQGPRIFHR